MAIQRSLLERLRNPPASNERHMYVSNEELFDSVLSNLNNLLNTTQGNCLTDEKYGLPHLTEIRSSMPHSLSSYEASIRTTIERHEPRLSALRIRHAPGADRGMELRFEISGLIQDEDGRRSVRFETYADEDGRLRIR